MLYIHSRTIVQNMIHSMCVFTDINEETEKISFQIKRKTTLSNQRMVNTPF